VSVLYIIGNGFDLAHGLPTSYLRFRDHARDRLSLLEEYFYFDLDDDWMWWDFENKLGHFDDGIWYDCHCLNDDAESWGEAAGVADAMVDEAEDMVEQLRGEFEQWIESIDLAGIQPSIALRPKCDRDLLAEGGLWTMLRL
jgi:hypothetical protein